MRNNVFSYDTGCKYMPKASFTISSSYDSFRFAAQWVFLTLRESNIISEESREWFIITFMFCCLCWFESDGDSTMLEKLFDHFGISLKAGL